MNLTTIGVLGAGQIGTGVITDLVVHGFNVVAVDLGPAELKRAEADVLESIRFAPLLLKGAPRVSKAEARQRLMFTDSMEKMSLCDLVIENVTENWNIKRSVYETLDAIARPEVCFAVNTSCISISRVAAITSRPTQVVGVHFMNPPLLKPTVEVIRSPQTSDQTMTVLSDLFARLNKKAVVVRDMPGFVSNRISHLFMNEAASVLQDSIATAEQIDEIFRECFGHKMGPLETADLIGLDTVMHSLDVLYDSFQDSKFRCCPLLRQMVAAGQLGRKTGRGFYEYPSLTKPESEANYEYSSSRCG
jgi:3-hydroxybutyryl-CoA dehydrogenase